METLNNNSSKFMDFFQEQQNENFDIYVNNSILDIKANISKHQSSLLYMHDMAFIASLADSCIVLPPPIKFIKYGKDAEKADSQYMEERKFTANHFKENIKASHKLDYRYTKMDKLFEKIREVYPDFGNNMQEKISPSDYSLYLTTFKKFRKAISNSLVYNSNTSSARLLLEKQDSISEVVDSIDFTRACEIEDRFMISELDTFFEKFEDMPPDIKHSFKKHSLHLPDGNKQSYFELAQKVKLDRTKRINKYSKIYNIYKKLEKHTYIQLKLDQSKYDDNIR